MLFSMIQVIVYYINEIYSMYKLMKLIVAETADICIKEQLSLANQTQNMRNFEVEEETQIILRFKG